MNAQIESAFTLASRFYTDPQEDIALCTAVQHGLQSATYDLGRYLPKRENGVHHFHLLLREFLGGE